jgi:hypothetical protein
MISDSRRRPGRRTGKTRRGSGRGGSELTVQFGEPGLGIHHRTLHDVQRHDRATGVVIAPRLTVGIAKRQPGPLCPTEICGSRRVCQLRPRPRLLPLVGHEDLRRGRVEMTLDRAEPQSSTIKSSHLAAVRAAGNPLGLVTPLGRASWATTENSTGCAVPVAPTVGTSTPIVATNTAKAIPAIRTQTRR